MRAWRKTVTSPWRFLSKLLLPMPSQSWKSKRVDASVRNPSFMCQINQTLFYRFDQNDPLDCPQSCVWCRTPPEVLKWTDLLRKNWWAPPEHQQTSKMTNSDKVNSCLVLSFSSRGDRCSWSALRRTPSAVSTECYDHCLISGVYSQSVFYATVYRLKCV